MTKMMMIIKQNEYDHHHHHYYYMDKPTRTSATSKAPADSACQIGGSLLESRASSAAPLWHSDSTTGLRWWVTAAWRQSMPLLSLHTHHIQCIHWNHLHGNDCRHGGLVVSIGFVPERSKVQCASGAMQATLGMLPTCNMLRPRQPPTIKKTVNDQRLS